MKKLSALLIVTMLNALHAYGSDITAFQSLVRRIIPEFENHIEARIIPAEKDKADFFTLSTQERKVIIQANNANSLAVGLNHYLKYYCHTVVSWFHDETMNMPEVLPELPHPITIKARVKERFFLNYCTFGYTMPWWGWQQWEHFIDWMAMNGINMPLAITGQESIWYKVWQQLGLDDKTIRSYFVGPAHLPWHRMINVDRWGGPLPMSWLKDQENLQKKIVQRERELNMRPILPAFSGHVPMDIKKVYPQAKITQIEPWDGFKDEYAPCFLDPMDPLFKKIQRTFLQIQNKTYGTDHIYGIDLFNEITPPSYDSQYLARVARQIFRTLQSVDKKAVWLQMGWLFYYNRKNWNDERMKAYLNANPADRQIILDYFCERKEVWRDTQRFFDTPFIWCYLGNFGGNTFLTGNPHDLNKRIEASLKEAGDKVCGIGATLEGLDCNPYIYEYVFEKAWDFPEHKDVDNWTKHLADERTGIVDEQARQTYSDLINVVYNSTSTSWHAGCLNQRPSVNRIKKGKKAARLTYDTNRLQAVAERLVEIKDISERHKFDVVNITRQWLSNRFDEILLAFVNELEGKRRFAVLKNYEDCMLELINDLDRLLATQPAFLLGKWIKDAKSKAENQEEETYYEQNARNLLTTWGDKGSPLNDYANRSWAGLTKNYYGTRWQMFFNEVNKVVLNGKPFDENEQKAFENIVSKFEYLWWKQCIGTFDAEPQGDPVTISKQLIQKYKQP